MSNEDQNKLLKAGFILLRKTSDNTLEAKFPELKEWHNLNSFPVLSKEENDTFINDLLIEENIILL